jgi:CheY-like chemotaxis protein
VGTLAGGIAHDFNNILSALMGFGTMLHMKIKDSDPLKRYTTQILTAAEKASSLTQSLLTFSRLQPVASKPVSLNNVIMETQELLKRIITEDIDLKLDLCRENLVILADVIHVNQILFNLASNAKDAMLEGGRLKIKTEVVELDDEFIRLNGFGKKGVYGLLSVSDSGIGMDEHTIQKVFDPFFTTKEVGKGTGLGLSSVYGIVKQHHGYVAVDSKKNRGACFRIYFPIIKDYVDSNQSSKDKDVLREGKETILVAEDDNITRLFIKELLTDFGYRIIEAVDGEDALEKFRDCEEISLVILDSVMPKLNGRVLYDTMKRIRPEVRTLFMSGYTKDIVISKGIIDHTFDFISKPIYPDKFLAKIREILDRKKGVKK